MAIQKKNAVRLKGEALRKLNIAIHERDSNRCIVCGRHVESGEKFHHEKKTGLKNDVMEEGVTLCIACHYDRHFSERLQTIRDKCREYLKNLYSEYWQ